MELVILIKTIFFSPVFGDKTLTTLKEYKMKDGSDAEIQYNKELENIRRSEGHGEVSISIVTNA